jgi:hypothetical protein
VPFLYAGEAVQTAIDQLILPLFAMIRHNQEASCARTRDLPPPRLMPGELCMAQAEQIMEEML